MERRGSVGSALGPRKNNYAVWDADPSRLAALRILGIAVLCLRMRALPGGRLHAPFRRICSCAGPLGRIGLTLILAAVTAGCGGGGGGGSSCPAGYRQTAEGCLPPLSQDVRPPGTDALADAAGPGDGSQADSDVGAAAGDGAGGPDGTGADAPSSVDVPEPTGRVGDPCRRDDQCDQGLDCFGWNGGYCTRLYCDAAGAVCPDDAVCLPIFRNMWACVRVCDPSADAPCRPDDPSYTCKPLPDENDQPVGACHETRPDAAGNGAACAEHAGCAGSLACLSSLPGGVCLELFCDRDADCEAPGSVCARFDGLPTCLPRCATDEDCAAVGNGALVCGEIRDLGGRTVGACLSGAAALPVGAACLSDAECASAVCETLGAGLCTTDEPRQPCDAIDDCPGASFCELLTPINACSAPCGASASQRCAAGGCVVDRHGHAACRPACSWNVNHTTHDCRSGTGSRCVYGIPLKDEANRGYFCAGLSTGDVGAECTADDDCEGTGAYCRKSEDAGDRDPGYCTRGCSAQRPCPFGTYCLDDESGAPRCLRVCFDDPDCPAGLACVRESSSAAVDKICAAP